MQYTYNETSFRILNVTFSQRCEHKCKWIHVLQQYSRRVNEIDMEEWESEREREKRERKKKWVSLLIEYDDNWVIRM
jgi:hypothetical protein